MIIVNKINAIQRATAIILTQLQQKKPLLVAVDGGSGAGKSTFVHQLAKPLNAVIIPLDDFYAANIPNDHWNQYTIQEKLANVFQWERVVTTAIKPLLAGTSASWTTYDFSAIQPDGTYKQQVDVQTRHPASIILLDGTYSACPAISDLVDLTILIDVPLQERHERLSRRESTVFLNEWHQRWDEVENYYFSEVRPKEFYHLVVEN